MYRFALTRLSLVIPTFIGLTLLAFFLIRIIPGDPIETMAGERGIDPVRHEQLRAEYGFDKPVLVQYGLYVGRPLHRDLRPPPLPGGRARPIGRGEPVIAEFAVLFPATVELALCAMLFALIIGLPAGIL